MARRPSPNTTWGGGCGDKKIIALLPFLALVTLIMMLADLPAVVRYVRTGEEPR